MYHIHIVQSKNYNFKLIVFNELLFYGGGRKDVLFGYFSMPNDQINVH